jgi:hypothetical protein
MKKKGDVSISSFLVIPEFVMLAVALDRFRDAPPVEPVLQFAHALVIEWPLPHRFRSLCLRDCSADAVKLPAG